jgi:peptide-methionine (S)-S-oxide reductase
MAAVMIRILGGTAAIVGLTTAILGARTPTSRERASAVLAGGCFWGIEAVYEHIRGVVDVVSGYAGGSAEDADYERVSTGRTGHAESVRIIFDPSVVSYDELLDVFFAVAHDPTQRNRQGPDVGPQYRSAIFFENEEQATIARARIDSLARAGVFSGPIVTEVTRLDKFYPAEEYHQDFATLHPNNPYIVMHDLPKLEHLRTRFPGLYRDIRS